MKTSDVVGMYALMMYQEIPLKIIDFSESDFFYQKSMCLWAGVSKECHTLPPRRISMEESADSCPNAATQNIIPYRFLGISELSQSAEAMNKCPGPHFLSPE